VNELPRGVAGEPAFQVGRRVSAEFTFSAEKAAQAAAAAGETLPPPPPGLDGSQFRLVAGPGLAAVWSEARGVPAVVVARAVAPTAYSSGIPFGTARDYLLSLPGLSRGGQTVCATAWIPGHLSAPATPSTWTWGTSATACAGQPRRPPRYACRRD
jgi:hypothetical protein